ncbi:MAG: hypothetical protein A2W95_06935 [Bacteroidetes bacterium GWA2_40_14]|jgi:hypothetical protein|nr:MAG: hypothetical protein A2W95_06935 [Bacteroidetes bacterium GWA2_40_14]HAZ04167.1 hypothetical protein [Marinilabiliales bacterium]
MEGMILVTRIRSIFCVFEDNSPNVINKANKYADFFCKCLTIWINFLESERYRNKKPENIRLVFFVFKMA